MATGVNVPVCWWHYWIAPPFLGVRVKDENHVVVSGACEQFVQALKQHVPAAPPPDAAVQSGSAQALPALARAARTLFIASAVLLLAELALCGWWYVAHDRFLPVDSATIELARNAVALFFLGLTWLINVRYWVPGALAVGSATFYLVPVVFAAILVAPDIGKANRLDMVAWWLGVGCGALLTAFGIWGVLVFRRANN